MRCFGTLFRVPAKPTLRFCRSLVPTSEEEEVFRTLLEQRLRSSAMQSVEMRVVGGWVRDKLLSQSPGDIDVCLSSVTGRDFASSVGEEFNVVAENPEKSKHLETAVVRVGSKRRVVDLSHMRTERYESGSRIPIVSFGSPEQDALRRDCTINALYFNLDTRQVEDPTGLGLADLEAGLIRAPTTALVTLQDDPLRLLRLIRFSSALGFRLDDELQAAFRDSSVLDGLARKVSRERIAVEIDKMLLLHGDGAVAAMQRLSSVPGLMDIAFWPRIWSDVADRVALNARIGGTVSSAPMLLALRSAAVLFPLEKGEKSRQTSLFLERLKWSLVRSRAVGRVLESVQLLDHVSDATSAGIWARQTGQEWWQPVIELASFLQGFSEPRGRLAEILERLQSLPLSERAFMLPPLDGDEIGRARGIRGPAIGRAKADLLRWQMEASDVSKESAIEYLQSKLY